MKFEVDTLVAAPLPAVWTWWTDFGRAGDSFVVDHGNGTGIRTIVSTDGKHVHFTDTSPLAGEIDRHVDILDGHRMHDVGAGKRPFISDWSFSSEKGGTRVRRVIEFRHPVAGALGPVGRWLAGRLIRKDLVAHARQCEVDLSG